MPDWSSGSAASRNDLQSPVSPSFRPCCRAALCGRSRTTRTVSLPISWLSRSARGAASGYWSEGSFPAALGKAVKSPTIAVASGNAPPGDSGLFRNILVPIDFSAVSIRALSAALVLAQQSGGRLQLLHVLEGFPYETVYSGSRAFRLIPELHAQMAWRNRELRSLIPPDAWNWSEIDVATVSGLAHEAIVATASKRRADLVVLGLPRRSRLEEFVAGSTVNRVLRRTTSPVLLVPGPSRPRRVTSHVEHDDVLAPYTSAPGLVASGAAASGSWGRASWAEPSPHAGIAVPSGRMSKLMAQVQAEYAEMPGLSVTLPQAQRLWAVDRAVCEDCGFRKF